ncbi:MAG: hemerythrin domain-containing protein [Elusimicrobia bacterium]|nr:hemerythrin domain-containing protein [Elusimicrobiota bacterium]
MTIIERFLQDHAIFRKHLADTLALARDLSDQATAPAVSDDDRAFAHKLRRHARMEAELLFPAMQRASSEKDRHETVQRYIRHGNDEHHSVAKRQAELHAYSGGVQLSQWRTTLNDFADGLNRHIDLEENEIFPLAQELLSPALLTELNQKADLVA